MEHFIHHVQNMHCISSTKMDPFLHKYSLYHVGKSAGNYSGICLKGLARLSWQKGSLLAVQISVS